MLIDIVKIIICGFVCLGMYVIDLADLLRDLHPLDDTSEHGVFVIKPGLVNQRWAR